MARIYIVDDNDTMREGMAVTLNKIGHQVLAFKSGSECLTAYRRSKADLVITDFKMDQIDGLELIRAIRAHDSDAVIVMVTAFGSIELAVDAIKNGAADFLTKPFTPDVLRAKVETALDLSRTRSELTRIKAHNEALTSDEAQSVGTQLIGNSEPILKLLNQIRKSAASDTTVMIHGESGTGKELVARLLHELSPRKNKPFVTTHCAALAETLLESELFGHERGAFTGAVKRKLGRFELADGGTLFLDEIGEISGTVQTKLLRVLQEREIERVGGEETVKVDVRVICATHRDLKSMVAAKTFREDLFYRLNIIPLIVPALRERPEDIPILAEHFLKKHGPRIIKKIPSFSENAVRALQRYAWPGNVREMENAIEQALVFAESDPLTEKDLPAFLQGAPLRASESLGTIPTPHGDRPLPAILEDLEFQLIQKALEKANGVKTETARLLGIKTSALYYKLEKYGLIEKGDVPTEP